MKASVGCGAVCRLPLARRDCHRQMVLFGRQRAGGKCRERARRILSLIEIQEQFAVFRHAGIKKSPGGVSVFAAGEVLEDEKQMVAFEERFETARLAFQFERGVAGTRIPLGIA